MGLFDPGNIAGVTSATIMAVCKQAYADHREGVGEWLLSIRKPEDMEVNELVELDASKGDGVFDRVSHAMHEGETFRSPKGETWKVTAYYLSSWELTSQDRPDSKVNVPEKDVYAWIMADCGEQPNPYVARIEVTYGTVQRAGYGIRKDGTFDLWYN